MIIMYTCVSSATSRIDRRKLVYPSDTYDPCTNAVLKEQALRRMRPIAPGALRLRPGPKPLRPEPCVLHFVWLVYETLAPRCAGGLMDTVLVAAVDRGILKLLNKRGVNVNRRFIN
jgi:hypothetical protein